MEEINGRSLDLSNGLKLLSLFRFNDHNNHSYYGAVMSVELGQNIHYTAYCGTTCPYNGFVGMKNTMEANMFADFLRNQGETTIGYFGNGVTFSEDSLIGEVALGVWWIGTDYQGRNSGGSYTTAIDGCGNLYNLMVKASDPTIESIWRMRQEDAVWHH